MRRVFVTRLVSALVFVFAVSFAARDAAAQKPSLDLLEAKGAATQTAISIVGQVKNISTLAVSGVTVYCDFQDGTGKVIRTEQTKLETDPLKPNMTSEFKVSTKASPDIKGYGFRFARLFGGPLTVKDSRKK